MKRVKTIGIATVALVAAMAVVGVTPSMATYNTALCEVDSTPCPEGNEITSIHMINTSGTVVTFLNSIVNILCLAVLADGTVLGASKAPTGQQIHATQFTYSGCGSTSTHNTCTITMEELPLLQLLNNGEDTGTLSTSNGKLRIKCTIFGFIKIDCLYDNTGISFDVTGGKEGGMVTASEVSASLLEGTGTCPEEAFLDGLMQALEETHVTGGPVHIESCMEGGEECKVASVGTTFEATSEDFVIESTEEEHEGEVKKNQCDVAVTGKVTDPTSKGSEDQMELSVTSVKFSKCTVGLAAKGLPWSMAADQTTFEAGGRFEFLSYLVETAFGCKYIMQAQKHLVFEKWDKNPNRELLEGTVVYEDGPWYCFNLRSVSGVLLTTSVSDPNLAGATTLEVN